MLPFLGIGDSGTVIVVHQTPTQCGTDLQWNEPHPVSVAHRQNVGEIAMRIRHSQQRLHRLGNPCTMREHVQVRVGSGTERPIVQRFDTTTSDFLLGFGTVFEFAATEFSPGTIVFRVPLREFLNRNAFPIAEAAFTHADVGMHFQAQRVGERMRGGCGTPQIGTDDQPVRNIGTTINIQFTQCVGRLANLPLSDFVEGNVDLALQTMRAL